MFSLRSKKILSIRPQGPRRHAAFLALPQQLLAGCGAASDTSAEAETATAAWGTRPRRAATTEVSTERAISSGVCAPINSPAGATMRATAAGSSPLAIKLSSRTLAFLALDTTTNLAAAKQAPL